MCKTIEEPQDGWVKPEASWGAVDYYLYNLSRATYTSNYDTYADYMAAVDSLMAAIEAAYANEVRGDK